VVSVGLINGRINNINQTSSNEDLHKKVRNISEVSENIGSVQKEVLKELFQEQVHPICQEAKYQE